jgi:hypothetical protein
MRLSAVTAVTAALAIAAPIAADAAVPISLTSPNSQSAEFCPKGIVDLGPFGPLGPYGPEGPYGANGPLAGKPNPIGDAATCGGLFTYIVRGGTLASFVNASTGG